MLRPQGTPPRPDWVSTQLRTECQDPTACGPAQSGRTAMAPAHSVARRPCKHRSCRVTPVLPGSGWSCPFPSQAHSDLKDRFSAHCSPHSLSDSYMMSLLLALDLLFLSASGDFLWIPRPIRSPSGSSQLHPEARQSQREHLVRVTCSCVLNTRSSRLAGSHTRCPPPSDPATFC